MGDDVVACAHFSRKRTRCFCPRLLVLYVRTVYRKYVFRLTLMRTLVSCGNWYGTVQRRAYRSTVSVTTAEENAKTRKTDFHEVFNRESIFDPMVIHELGHSLRYVRHTNRIQITFL